MAKRTCIEDGCETPAKARGLCNAHYLRLWKNSGGLKRKSTEQRFWEKVDKTSTCWNWIGADNGHGYGNFFGANRRLVYAHRFSYELHNGPIPSGAHVDHTCHNRGCVNPGHMRLVTQAQNNQNRAGAQSNSRTGIRGVRWHDGAWEARARKNGVDYSGGRFDSIEDAERAAIELRNQLFTHNDEDRRCDLV